MVLAFTVATFVLSSHQVDDFGVQGAVALDLGDHHHLVTRRNLAVDFRVFGDVEGTPGHHPLVFILRFHSALESEHLLHLTLMLFLAGFLSDDLGLHDRGLAIGVNVAVHLDHIANFHIAFHFGIVGHDEGLAIHDPGVAVDAFDRTFQFEDFACSVLTGTHRFTGMLFGLFGGLFTLPLALLSSLTSLMLHLTGFFFALLFGLFGLRGVLLGFGVGFHGPHPGFFGVLQSLLQCLLAVLISVSRGLLQHLGSDIGHDSHPCGRIGLAALRHLLSNLLSRLQVLGQVLGNLRNHVGAAFFRQRLNLGHALLRKFQVQFGLRLRIGGDHQFGLFHHLFHGIQSIPRQCVLRRVGCGCAAAKDDTDCHQSCY